MQNIKNEINKKRSDAKFNVWVNAISLMVLLILFPYVLKLSWLYITLWSLTLVVILYVTYSRLEVYKSLKV